MDDRHPPQLALVETPEWRDVEPLDAELRDLDPEVDARCVTRLHLANTHQAAGAYHWIEAGKCHAANKAELGPRKWAPWCKLHLVALNTADSLIRIAERFDPILLTVNRMEPLSIDLRALIALGSPAVPVSAAVAAVELAASGTHITRAQAEDLIAQARAEGEEAVRAELQDKLILTKEDVADSLAKVAGKFQKQLDRAGKDLSKVIKQRDAAFREIEVLKEAEPTMPPFDSGLSFKAMCVAGAIETLRKELKLAPEQLIAIERELATRFHQNPHLAEEKFAAIRGNLQAVIPWLADLMKLLSEENSR